MGDQIGMHRGSLNTACKFMLSPIIRVDMFLHFFSSLVPKSVLLKLFVSLLVCHTTSSTVAGLKEDSLLGLPGLAHAHGEIVKLGKGSLSDY